MIIVKKIKDKTSLVGEASVTVAILMKKMKRSAPGTWRSFLKGQLCKRTSLAGGVNLLEMKAFISVATALTRTGKFKMES